MNNADRFKTGQPFYALVTQVTALFVLTSSIKLKKLNYYWRIVYFVPVWKYFFAEMRYWFKNSIQ